MLPTAKNKSFNLNTIHFAAYNYIHSFGQGASIAGFIGGQKLKAELEQHHYVSDLLAMVEFDGLNLRDVQRRLVSSIHVISGFLLVTSLMGGFGAVFTFRILLKSVSTL